MVDVEGREESAMKRRTQCLHLLNYSKLRSIALARVCDITLELWVSRNVYVSISNDVLV